MEYYETDDDYTRVEISQILDWFNDEIGTDYEINESASGEPDKWYVIFLDLIQKDVVKLMKFENNLRKGMGKC